jgi:hypothetical protein
MPMNTQVVCYVQRKRISDWKRLVLTHKKSAFIYGSNDERVFASKLKPGSLLWVVSSIPHRPPELVARLEINVVAQRNDPKLKISKKLLSHFREFNWIAKGTSKSEFFGHNNATKALLETVYLNSAGQPWILSNNAKHWHSKFGIKLFRPALICPKSVIMGNRIAQGGKYFQELADTKNRAIFISWKWSDNTEDSVLQLAYELAKQNFMPWLDLLALPRARALKKVQQDAPKLERLLRYGYRQSVAVLAIQSEHYRIKTTGSAKNWTQREWAGSVAPRKRIIRIVYQPKGANHATFEPVPDIRLDSHNPVAAAHELLSYFS